MAHEKTLAQGEGLTMDKNDKKEAIFYALLNEAKEGIGKVYLPGTMAYIKLNHSKVYDEVLMTEMRLDYLWQTMRKGRNTLTQFKKTLKEWKDLYFKAVDLQSRNQRSI